MLSLAALPWVLAARDPEHIVLRLDGAHLSARRLDSAAAGMAARLRRRGAAPGDRVALLCGNGLAFPVAYFGALRLGAVAAPLSPAAAVAELAAALRGLRARHLVVDAEQVDAGRAALRLASTGATLHAVIEGAGRSRHEVGVDALVEHPADDPLPAPPGAAAVILATSGTTGLPKRAVHSHAGLLLNARAVASEVLGLGEDDVQLASLPLAHSYGMSAVLNASLLAGAAVAVCRRSDAAAALAALHAERVTVLQAVPTMLARLVAAGGPRPAGLRRVVVSGAPLPAGLAAAVHQRLCSDVVERYGMTEASPLTARMVPPDGGAPGDVGRPLWGVVVRVVGDAPQGELEASAPSMFVGYDRDPAATAAVLRGGFLRTGDLGRVAVDGRVELRGRLKDVIVRGGNNVAAAEVERVLEEHAGVAEAAVVGVPDADLGEEVAAAVVLRRGAGRREAAVLDALRQRCGERLAGYKMPRRILVVAALPRTSTGKLRKDEVRALFD